MLVAFFMVFISGPGFSQSPVTGVSYEDSLKHKLTVLPHDTSRVTTLFSLADYYSDKDTTIAMGYIHEAEKYIVNHAYYSALLHFYKGSVYFDANPAKSQKEYLTAEKLLQNIPGKAALVFRSRSWASYGALEQRKDNEKGYTQILIDKAIPLALRGGDSVRVAKSYLNLSIAFSNQLNYKMAISYLNQAIAVFEKSAPNSLELADSYTFAAKNYVFLKDFKPVKPLLDKARKILKPDPNSVYLIELELVQGMYYARIGNYKMAFESYDSGIALSKRLKRPYDFQAIMLQKYMAYKALGDYSQALKIMKELVAQGEVYMRHKNRMLFYYELAQAYEKTGDTKKAYEWLHKYSVLADSSFAERIQSDIAALEAKYQSAEKEKKIDQLQSRNEKAILTIKNNELINWLLAVVCLFLMAVTILVLLFYRNNKRLWVQQKQLHDLELEKIKQDHKISMLSAMLEGQEQERTRLARDLHDGLGGLLSSIKIELSQFNDHSNQTIKVGIDRTLLHLDDAVNELRRIARSLMPEILMKYGLAEATKEFCKNFQETGVNVICQVFNYQEITSSEKQVVLYRIIQELVNNAVKHAVATQILVIIQQSDHIIYVTVEDDGKGFDTTNLSSKTGAGLSNVKARADFLNATMDIQSSPGNGTSVTIECEI